jgi:EmrB/QacA subfamily drug resistance transporter
MQMITHKNNIYCHRWWTLAGLGMALIILNLDLTIVNLALPILGHTFHTKLSTLQWICNIYSLTFAALVMFMGKLADHYGHRLIYLCGITFFFIGSLIAGLAPDVITIILGRLFQGIGMAGTFGMIFILANRVFPAEERRLATGLLVTFVGVAQAIGPTVGGFIIEHLGWRWAFLINLPFCMASFIILLLTYRDEKTKANSNRFIHYPSAFLLMAIYFGLVFVFNTIQDFGAQVTELIAAILISALVVTGVFFWQRKLTEPFLTLKLFQNRTYCVVSMVRPLFQFNFGAFFFVLPLYLQNIADLSPKNSGLVMLIMTLALAISSATIGRLNQRISAASAIIFAHLLSITGFFILAVTPIIPIQWLPFSIALVLIGINIGIIYAVTNYLSVNSLPLKHQGVGYGFFTANAFFFYSIGIAITGHLLSSIGFSDFNHSIAQAFGHGSPLFNNVTIKPYINGARSVHLLTKLYPQYSATIQTLAIHAFSRSYAAIMWLFTSLSTLGLIFSFFLLKHEKKTK